MPLRRLQSFREGRYTSRQGRPWIRRRRVISKLWALGRTARPPGRHGKSQGDNVMPAAAAATQKKQVPLSNKAREMMEAINVDAAKHHVWIRTQANAPAQRPWFSATGGEGSGQLA